MTAIATAQRPPIESIDRQFDQLSISQFGSAQSFSVRPSVPDPERWPFIAVYVLAGTAEISTGLRLATADLAVLRTGGRFDVVAGDASELLIVRIPRDVLGPHAAAMRSAAGRVRSTAEGTASIVAHLLKGVAAQGRDYVPENPGQFAQHLVGFLSMACHDGMAAADRHGRRGLLALAKEYIEAHLGDIDLGPDRIAGHANVSTRTLHRLFEGEGSTVRGWIRARRLEHCRVELGDSAWSDLPVSAVGARWGLWDAAHFSRLFKAT